MSEKPIQATLKVALKPWPAPSYASRVAKGAEKSSGIHVSDLSDDALEDLALAWIEDLYRKAGRPHAPFYKPAKASPESR